MQYRTRARVHAHGWRPAAAGIAAALGLAVASVSGASAQATTVAPISNPTAGELQTLNQALLVERLLTRFYNQNADKPYLTGSGTITNPPATTPGTTTPGTDSTTANPPAADQEIAFNSTLSGAAVLPPVTTSATATAQFVLGKDRRTMNYDVRLNGLSSPVTAIHLHEAKPGEPGGIIHQILENPANGVSTGQVAIRPEELDPLMNGEFFIDVHTQQFPLGELRGQVALAGALPPGTTVPPVTPVPPDVPIVGGRDSLRGMVAEFRDHHTAHIALLEQSLGAGAQPVPTFQNLDAPTLSQFLTMGVALEDFAAGAHQFLITNPWPGVTPLPGTTPEAVTPRAAGLLIAIALDDARHAGALRAYRKVVSTAEGGDPTIPISEEGAFNAPRSAEQMNAFLLPYLTAPGTTPPTTGTQPPTPGTTPPATGNPPVY